MSLREDIAELKDRLDELEARLETIEEGDEPEDEDDALESDGFTQEAANQLRDVRAFARDSSENGSKTLAAALSMAERLTSIERRLRDIAETTTRTAGKYDEIARSFTGPAASLTECAKRVEGATAALSGELNLRGRIAAAVRRLEEPNGIGSGTWNGKINIIADAIERPTFAAHAMGEGATLSGHGGM